MSKITDIAPQVNNPDRCSVYLDGKFAFGISELDLIKFSLKIGQVLTESQINDVLHAVDETKCQDYANSLVCSRMYTEKELRKKLTSKKFTTDVIETVISRLKEYGYVDDWNYAEMYINETKQKYGVFKLKQKLYEKGVTGSVIDELLSEFDNKETAVNQLRLKLRNKPLQPDDIQKMLRFLAQKGFSYDEAHEAIRIYTEETDGFCND